MKTLVVCVDRDDDIGVKTGIKGPIVGRSKNLMVATTLGIRDPEDADINSIFQAISIYDNLIKEENEAEIVTICGDSQVGLKSDQILTAQLEQVLKDMNPDRAILVSDGVEDEAIFPLISSRIKVDSVKRVLVKQSQSIESTFHLIANAFRDEKTRGFIVSLICLPLILIGLFVIIPITYDFWMHGYGTISKLPAFGLGITAFLLGIVLTFYSYRVGESLSEWYKDVKVAISTGKISITLTLVAIVVFIIGLYFGYGAADNPKYEFWDMVIVGLDKSLIWIFFAAWIYIMGSAADTYFRRGRVPISFWLVTISLIAIGFVVYGALDSIRLLLGEEQAFMMMVLFLSAGIAFALLGAFLQRYIKTHIEKEARWRH